MTTPSFSAAETAFTAFQRTAIKSANSPFLCVLPETAAAYGVEPGEITYGQADRAIADLAAAYRRQGYGHGHRVGLLLENRPAFFLHWFALNSLGVSVVPINPDLRSAELEYLIGHSELVAIVAIAKRHADLGAAVKAASCDVPIFAADAAPVAVGSPPRADAPGVNSECALLYTSGTTGKPKGCVLANEYFLAAAQWYASRQGLISLRPGVERMLTPLPIFHMNAMAYSAGAMIATGGCLIVLDRFHPKSWWRNVRESRATVVHYLGVMPAMLMNMAAESAGDRAHSIRFGFGAGVDRRLHGAFEARFGFPLIEAWAMTETGAGAVVAANHEPRHIGTNCFGRPSAELEVRIVADDGSPAGVDQPGELLVRHAGAEPRFGFFREYLKDDEATAEAWADGWFHTGDVVRAAPDGSLHFIDRKKNVIRRSGENISAVEVESVLAQHPAIAQVAVAGAPDAMRGDEVVACVVPREQPADTQDLAQDIVAWCLQRLAYYKAPGYVAFVPAIPLTSTNKIQRGQLKELAASVVSNAGCVDTRSMKRRVA